MEERLVRKAQHQQGVVTESEARAAGLTRADIIRRRLNGHWRERHSGVFIASLQPPTSASECRAALAAVGGTCALAGHSAAWVWRLPGFDAVKRPELIVPGDRRYTQLVGVDVRRVVPHRFATVVRNGWPVTTLETTVRDLGASLPRPDLRNLVQHLLLERRTTVSRLSHTLGRGLSGAASLREILEEVDPAFQSLWEHRLHQALVRRGLRPRAQFLLRTPSGRRCYLDLALPEALLGVEVDGFVQHMSRFAADRRRANSITVELGWALAQYAVADLADDLESVADEIARYARIRTAAVAS